MVDLERSNFSDPKKFPSRKYVVEVIVTTHGSFNLLDLEQTSHSGSDLLRWAVTLPTLPRLVPLGFRCGGVLLSMPFP